MLIFNRFRARSGGAWRAGGAVGARIRPRKCEFRKSHLAPWRVVDFIGRGRLRISQGELAMSDLASPVNPERTGPGARDLTMAQPETFPSGRERRPRQVAADDEGPAAERRRRGGGGRRRPAGRGRAVRRSGVAPSRSAHPGAQGTSRCSRWRSFGCLPMRHCRLPAISLIGPSLRHFRFLFSSPRSGPCSAMRPRPAHGRVPAVGGALLCGGADPARDP